MRVVFVSREIWPFVEGGGIGRYVADAMSALADHAEVTVVTTDRFAARHRELAAADDPRLGGTHVSWRFAPEPADDLSPYWTLHHAWSVAAFRTLREVCLEQRPDIVEFEDYGGSAAATVHAARAGDPAFRDVRIVVRAHTTWEMTQVLDGLPLDQLHDRTVMALERESLRWADRVVAPDGTLAAYRRYYGPEGLAPAHGAPPPFVAPPPVAADREPPPGDRLRILFVGRMQRLKGAPELVRAIHALERDDVELTLVGGDTDTAPGGRSMREHLRGLAAGNDRIAFLDRVDPARLPELLQTHHVVAAPSHFESFSYVVREALAANRPVLAADVGGVAGGFEEGRSGWLVAESTAEALQARVSALADDRGAIEELIREGVPRATLDAVPSVDAYRDAMAALAAEPAPRAGSTPAASAPVTAVVLADHADGSVTDTLTRLEAEAPEGLEVVLVAEDIAFVPARAAGRVHRLVVLGPEAKGVAAGLRAGLAARRGTGPVLPLRAGEQLLPGFIERAAEGLARDPALAYVTAHAAGREPECVPVGNAAAALLPEYDVAATVALLRPDALRAALADLREDEAGDAPAVFAALARLGRFGAVIPETLVTNRAPESRHRASSRGLWSALARTSI